MRRPYPCARSSRARCGRRSVSPASTRITSERGGASTIKKLPAFAANPAENPASNAKATNHAYLPGLVMSSPISSRFWKTDSNSVAVRYARSPRGRRCCVLKSKRNLPLEENLSETPFHHNEQSLCRKSHRGCNEE